MGPGVGTSLAIRAGGVKLLLTSTLVRGRRFHNMSTCLTDARLGGTCSLGGRLSDLSSFGSGGGRVRAGQGLLDLYEGGVYLRVLSSVSEGGPPLRILTTFTIVAGLIGRGGSTMEFLVRCLIHYLGASVFGESGVTAESGEVGGTVRRAIRVLEIVGSTARRLMGGGSHGCRYRVSPVGSQGLFRGGATARVFGLS